MSKQALAGLFSNSLCRENIAFTVSITRQTGTYTKPGVWWVAKIVDGIEGIGNTPIQALEAAVENVKKMIKEVEEERKADKALKDVVAKELFGTELHNIGRSFTFSRSPTDLVTDVAALIKKIVRGNCITLQDPER